MYDPRQIATQEEFLLLPSTSLFTTYARAEPASVLIFIKNVCINITLKIIFNNKINIVIL